MAFLGIDFGTTNSTVATSTSDGKVKTSRVQSMADYVPSALSFERASGEVAGIGQAARQHLAEPDTYVGYTGFKLLLGEADHARLAARGYGDRTPGDVTRRYLAQLLAEWRTAEAGAHVDGLVVTVPNTWMGENSHRAREELLAISQEVGSPEARLVSEPVAAAAYFGAWQRERHGRAFEGHLMVVDVGGGTADVNLSRVMDGRVEVLENAGADQGEDGLGCAGQAFDYGVVRTALAQAGRDVDAAELTIFLQQFEEKKVHQGAAVSRALAGPPGAVAFQFGYPPVPVPVDALREVFAARVRPSLTSAVTRVQESLDRHGVDVGDSARFRVLLVGGFSQFPLVEQTVREILQLAADDPRLSSMPREEGTLAIAKGAALIAAGAAQVVPQVPISVGFWNLHHVYAYNAGHQPHRRDERILIERGTPIVDRVGPVWFPEVVALGGTEARLELLLDDGRGRAQFRVERPLRDLLPDLEHPGGLWEIGISVDVNLIYRFHARLQGAERESETPLGRLGLQGFHSL